MIDLLFLFCAGLLAGAMNALAGGGSFVSLPALIAVGVPSVQANASSTVALWPGGAAGAWTYLERLRPVCGVEPRWLLLTTLLGGLLGSLLLLWTPSSAFDSLLPWLLLLATLALAFGRRVAAKLHGERFPSAALVVQFVLGVYGGYFGGAVGLMMLAAWSLFGEHDIKSLQGSRMLLVSVANSVATVIFILAGAVRWLPTVAMLAGGLLGGIAGARVGLMIPPRATRIGTLCATTAITVIFFLRAYGGL